jgi:hypothetical protein
LDLDGADASTRALEDALAQRHRGHQEAPCETA